MKNTRLDKIIKTIGCSEGATVKELADLLQVSEMTIRRDIKILKKEGIIKNVSGAILLNKTETRIIEDYSLLQHVDQHVEEKHSISEKAASLISEGDVIYIDIGSTTPGILDFVKQKMPITVVCCTVNVLLKLYSKEISNIYLLGGKYRSDLQMFVSNSNTSYLKSIRMSKAFISAAGITDSGVTCINDVEVPVKKYAMQSAEKKYLLIDSSKFGQVTPEYFASISDFTAIITDSGINTDWAKKIKKSGIKLIIA